MDESVEWREGDCVEVKWCTVCKCYKYLFEFLPRKDRPSGYKSECKLHAKEYKAKKRASRTAEQIEQDKIKSKKYCLDNIDSRKEYMNSYYEKNKEQILNDKKNYYEDNKDQIKEKGLQYRTENKERVAENRRNYINNRMENDPSFKLRVNISSAIRWGCKENNFKKESSILSVLPYSMQELREHLESQFEWWMTWENWGVYDSKIWKDDDPTTWRWQLDHIIPHSMFKYSSMKDSLFLICWGLKNLRPYNAKQNILDGTKRVRHINSESNIEQTINDKGTDDSGRNEKS